jgi:hypothetical protein
MTALNARLTIPALAAAFAFAVAFAAAGVSLSAAANKAEPHLAHSVFFTLKDHSPEARAKFVASCHKYLTGHEGAVSFSVGVIAEDVEEPGVSVRDFDVSLLVVFDSKASEAKYLKNARHTQFVDENKDSFAKVRVFDSYLTKP